MNDTASNWELTGKSGLHNCPLSCILPHSLQCRAELESLRTELAQLPNLAEAEVSAIAKRDAAIETVRQIKAAVVTALQAETEAARHYQDADQELQTHELSNPGFWIRLFKMETEKPTGLHENLYQPTPNRFKTE